MGKKNYPDGSQYTKAEIDALLAGETNVGVSYSKAEVDTLLAAKATNAALADKADAEDLGTLQETVEGMVAANQAASVAATAADLATDFNALLVKLKAAGLMAADL